MLFLVFFFKNRGCSWLPANRVRDSFANRLIVLSDSNKLLLNKVGITEKEILSALTTADIDFSASRKNGDLKVYVFNTEDDKKIFVTMPKESFVAEILPATSSIQKVKNSVTGNAPIIRYPSDKNLIYFDSTDLVKCTAAKNKLTPEIVLRQLKKNGKINFEQTNFLERPKPTHELVFSQGGRTTIAIKAYWYKDKIAVFHFDAGDSLNCN